jgi:hypothetical protein
MNYIINNVQYEQEVTAKFNKFGTDSNYGGFRYYTHTEFLVRNEKDYKKIISRISTKLIYDEKASILIKFPETGMTVNFGKSDSSSEGEFLKYKLGSITLFTKMPSSTI